MQFFYTITLFWSSCLKTGFTELSIFVFQTAKTVLSRSRQYLNFLFRTEFSCRSSWRH